MEVINRNYSLIFIVVRESDVFSIRMIGLG